MKGINDHQASTTGDEGISSNQNKRYTHPTMLEWWLGKGRTQKHQTHKINTTTGMDTHCSIVALKVNGLNSPNKSTQSIRCD